MFTQPYMRILTPIIGVAIVIALGAYVYYTVKQAKYLYSGPVTISVVGEGEAVTIPDIATFGFSVYAEGKDATEAQTKSAEAMNEVLAYLKENGIEDKDVKTEYYNLNPRYEYTQSICNSMGYCPAGERILRGYEVSQHVTVKIRDTAKAGELIGGVGTRGATDVSGLTFTVDDDEAVKAEARSKAIADAKAKAEKLADELDVRIVRMTSFWEEQGYMPYNSYGMGMEKSAVAQSADMAMTPSVPTGENTSTVRVNISYEIR